MSKKQQKQHFTIPEGMKVAHIRPTEGPSLASHGGATVAYREVEGGIEMAVAFCNEKDRFNRVEGRRRACGRLAKRQMDKGRFAKAEITLQEFEDILEVWVHHHFYGNVFPALQLEPFGIRPPADLVRTVDTVKELVANGDAVLSQDQGQDHGTMVVHL